MTDWTDDIKKRLEDPDVGNIVECVVSVCDIKNLLEEREVLREALNLKGLCECYSDEDLDFKCIRCKALDWEPK